VSETLSLWTGQVKSWVRMSAVAAQASVSDAKCEMWKEDEDVTRDCSDDPNDLDWLTVTSHLHLQDPTAPTLWLLVLVLPSFPW
jgi:hypothetical protein